MRMTVIPIVISALGTISKKLDKVAGRVENWRTSRTNPNYTIVKIDQNTEKSPGDLKRLAVIQTLAKNHQLTLAWKPPKKY